MNPIPFPRHERRRLLFFFLGSMAALPLLIGIGFYHLFSLTSEAAVLRRELLAGNHFGTKPIQGTVGSFLIGGANLVLSFLPEVPEEAREILGAVNSASGGVYQLSHAPSAQERRRVFAAADVAMERQGWIRVVGVNEGTKGVVVYVPAGEETSDELRVCVAVFEQRNLVVVSARADADGLGRFVQGKIPKISRE